MHGVFEENVGVFPKVFGVKMTIFLTCLRQPFLPAKRGDEKTYYFEPIRAKDYLSTPSISTLYSW